jgi:deoxycytidylate deaminase
MSFARGFWFFIYGIATGYWSSLMIIYRSQSQKTHTLADSCDLMLGCFRASLQSDDHETMVGAAIQLDGRWLFDCNRFPQQAIERACCAGNFLPATRPDKYPLMVHAEINAILHVFSEGNTYLGNHLYSTHLPCPECLKFIAAVGISKVTYAVEYGDACKAFSLADTLGITLQRWNSCGCSSCLSIIRFYEARSR